MGKKQRRKTPLRLIDGGLHCETSFYHLRIVAAPELENQRFAVLLGRVLRQTTLNHLRRPWLITSPTITSDIIEILEAELRV
jgi:hypothetical protein